MDKLKALIANLNAIAEWYEGAVEKAEAAKDVVEVLKFFQTMKEDHAELDKARKRIYHALNRLDKSILPKRFEDMDVDKVAVPTLARSFYTLDKMSASIVDKPAGFEWLRSNGGEDLITETVNAGSLASFVRDMILEQGVEPPPDVIKVTQYQVIGSSKYTPKKDK